MTILTRFTNLTRSPGDPKVLARGPSSMGYTDRLARDLGWFSIGLGLTELFGARALARTLGMQGSEWLIRLFGAREVAAGVVSLSVDATPGIISRVAGDALDIAVLASARHSLNPQRANVDIALGAVIAVTILDIICAQSLRVRHARRLTVRSYADRSGFPQGVAQARGAARKAPSLAAPATA